MKKKPAPPAAFEFLPAVILAIDSASSSGAVVHVPELQKRKVVRYDTPLFGLVRTQEQRQEYVEEAVELGKEEGLPVVVVGEEWTRHGLSAAAFVSLCENWGKWLAEIEQAKIPEHRVVRVLPDIWRNALFGSKRAKDRESNKRMACRYSEQVLKRAPEHHDIAEARCIGVWGSRSGEAHLSIQKRKAA